MPHKDPEKRKEYDRAYRAANRGKIAARRKAWFAKNPGKFAEYSRQQRAKNPEKARAYMREYQRKRNAALKAIRDGAG
jgi:hypothetical protein